MRGARTSALQPFAGDVGVDLGGRNIGVAKQQLHDAQVGTVVEQMGGEGVAQHVRRELFRGNAGDRRIPLDELPESLAGHGAATGGDEQGVALPALEDFRPRLVQIAAEPVDGLFAEWHQALLAAFAEGAQHAFVETDFVQFQIDQLGNAQARGVEGFQHGAVAQAEGAVGVRRGEQAVNLFLRHDLGQARRAGRIGEFQRRVGGDAAAPELPAIEAA